MRRLSFIGGALAIVLVGLAAACGSDPVSNFPTGPSAPGVTGLQISGPASVAPGQSAQFIAETRLSDGAVKSTASPTNNIRWRSSNASLLQVSTSGLVTAGQNRGEAILTAELVPPNTSVRGTREVIVLPDGTYRVVGSVSEAEAPAVSVVGARVEVSGTSLATTTDGGGNYRLYGVPAAAEIRVTANGYLPSVRTVQLAGHVTQNFQLALSGPRLTLNGPYRLTIDAPGGCSGSQTLPADLRTRTYDASVTTTGSQVEVVLTEPRFRLNSIGRGNKFSGRADATGVRFTLNPFYSYYYPYYGPTAYPNVAERLSNNTHLIVEGTALTSQVNDGVSGSLSGGIYNLDSRFPNVYSFLGGCFSTGLRLTLTPR